MQIAAPKSDPFYMPSEDRVKLTWNIIMTLKILAKEKERKLCCLRTFLFVLILIPLFFSCISILWETKSFVVTYHGNTTVLYLSQTKPKTNYFEAGNIHKIKLSGITMCILWYSVLLKQNQKIVNRCGSMASYCYSWYRMVTPTIFFSLHFVHPETVGNNFNAALKNSMILYPWRHIRSGI